MAGPQRWSTERGKSLATETLDSYRLDTTLSLRHPYTFSTLSPRATAQSSGIYNLANNVLVLHDSECQCKPLKSHGRPFLLRFSAGRRNLTTFRLTSPPPGPNQTVWEPVGDPNLLLQGKGQQPAPIPLTDVQSIPTATP
jgi:hypothetical protein